mmetsp:Transcript_2182/g.4136  ORF Transcript_2182/g.4136 Transcript_2182/m.4136 type:complete len:259 (+) Transcript_2182:54-830(+)
MWTPLEALEPFSVRWNCHVPLPHLLLPEYSPLGMDTAALTPPRCQMWWTLLWCHEHSFKGEGTRRGKYVHSVVKQFGGRLVPVKKSVAVVAALRSSKGHPQVLVTNWRNARPIMEHLTNKHDCTAPRLIVVLCTSHKQFLRAWHWAQTVPQNACPLYVCVEDQIPPLLLNGVIEKCFSPMDGDIDTVGGTLPRKEQAEESSWNEDSDDCSQVGDTFKLPKRGGEQDCHAEEAVLDGSDDLLPPMPRFLHAPLSASKVT